MIPELLPCEAIKELLIKPTAQTEKQHAMILNSIPQAWLQILKVAGEDRSATNWKWLKPVVQKWRYLSCY